MEFIREFLTSKRFNTFSFVVVISWIMFGVILLGIFAEMEVNEQSSFRCDITSERKEYIQGQCLDHFETTYNGALPVYCFVIINFFLIGITCAIYSLFVKSRIEGLDRIADLETPRHATSSRRLFKAYCCQLGIRFTLGTLFIILQTQVLYPSSFPFKYDCQLTEPQTSGDKHANKTNDTRNSNISLTFECQIPQAAKRAFWTNVLCVVNGLFAFCVLVEMIYVLLKATMVSNFAEDKEFYERHLLGRKDKPLPFQVFVENMKRSILRDTENLRPLLPMTPGENQERTDLKLDQIYTNLVIHPGRKNYKFWGERHEIFQEYLGQETTCERKRVDKAEDIFAPDEDSGNEVPQRILVLGRPGIGKTLLCRKIVRDWANGRLFNQTTNEESVFDFTFLFKFRWFNSAENLNLEELLVSLYEHSRSIMKDMFHYICQNPEKVLLIFDGLDELKDNSSIINEETYVDSITEAMPFSALYGKLASGKLLAGATVVTTTRTTALPKAAHLSFHKVLEILGFTSEQVAEYVERFMIDDRNAGQRIWDHISSNANLLSLCYIPVNCCIICSYLKELLKLCRVSDPRSTSLPTTLTEIYNGVVRMFVLKHSPEYRTRLPTEAELFSDGFTSSVQETLTKLGDVALKGTMEGRLIFESSEVHGLEESGLFHRLPNQQTAPFKFQAQFCFIHLTVQEFFAAKEVIRTSDRADLRRFVSRHITDGSWQLVLQFVAGLLRSLDEPNIDIFTDLLPTSSEHRHRSALTWWPRTDDKELALTLCKCIFEYKDKTPAITQRLAALEQKGVNMSMSSLYSTDCTAIVHVLKNLKEIPWVDLSFNSFGSSGCVEIAKFFQFGNLLKLSSICSHITDEGVQHLSNAIAQTQCNLKWLNLSGNDITDAGVKHLCDALSQAECKLTGLLLNMIGITDVGVKHIADVLQTGECKLTELHLCTDGISDMGAKYLSATLAQAACTLVKLVLTGNQITDVGVQYLCDALSQTGCNLAKLDLSQNEITDVGLKHVSDAATRTECNFVKLILRRNGITDLGARHLSVALSHTGCKLTKVDLSYNQITDKGAKDLADAISRSNCPIAKLNLSGNQLSEGAQIQVMLALSN